ncbi:hypothetical protein AMTR_s00052p00215040 [Amborella trichopoda]|uniref:Uncharacterized protein n=1 Tax=Amborella trichopoda TaxID=13333 RepID=U5CT85_AMBTC|nr:hypothetical protein AMTR_s00052p00215040 [Amborella trichopoda]
MLPVLDATNANLAPHQRFQMPPMQISHPTNSSSVGQNLNPGGNSKSVVIFSLYKRISTPNNGDHSNADPLIQLIPMRTIPMLVEERVVESVF